MKRACAFLWLLVAVSVLFAGIGVARAPAVQLNVPSCTQSDSLWG
jgi:hypothetical protein